MAKQAACAVLTSKNKTDNKFPKEALQDSRKMHNYICHTPIKYIKSQEKTVDTVIELKQ